MRVNLKTCVGAFLAFVVLNGTLESQQPGKPADNKNANELESTGKGADSKPTILPDTTHWAGYVSQPQGRFKWYYIQLQLTEDDGSQITGKCHVGVVGRPENYVTKIKGGRNDKEIRFKDLEVFYKTEPPAGTGFWLVNRSYIGKLGPYGSLLGDWSDRAGPNGQGEGQIFLVRMDYNIVIQRQQQEADGLTRSTLSLNGVVLGDVYENTNKLIPAGVYPGRRLYSSAKNVVQSGERRLTTKGDFLLEIAKVPKRKNILIIPGDNAANMGEGVMAGTAIKKGETWLAPPVLAALRWHFYGTDYAVPFDPLYAMKELNMKIEVRDAPQGAVALPAMKQNESTLQAPLTRPIRLEQAIEVPKK